MPDSHADTPQRRQDISRRLKAARTLAGTGIKIRKNSKSKKGEVAELSIDELATRSPLPANRLTANRLREIEQMLTHTRPSEITALSEALGLDLRALPIPGDYEVTGLTRPEDDLEREMRDSAEQRDPRIRDSGETGQPRREEGRAR